MTRTSDAVSRANVTKTRFGKLKEHPVWALIVFIAAVVGAVAAFWKDIKELYSAISGPSVSIAATLPPNNVNLRAAIEHLVQLRQQSAHFDRSCSDELLGRRLKGGQSLSGKNIETVIKNLPDHLIDRSPNFQLDVKHGGGSYVIKCKM